MSAEVSPDESARSRLALVKKCVRLSQLTRGEELPCQEARATVAATLLPTCSDICPPRRDTSVRFRLERWF
jgi:hypothetical protein